VDDINKFSICTGKSLSEALIFELSNPQYDDRFFIELSTRNSMNNLSSYCGLVDAKLRASHKDLPVDCIRLRKNFSFFSATW
jgi:hypothetical protein